MFAQGEQSAAKIQLANSSIFGEALGLIKDSSEYTEGLEFEIVMDALEGVVNFFQNCLLLCMQKIKHYKFLLYVKVLILFMEPVSEVYEYK